MMDLCCYKFGIYCYEFVNILIIAYISVKVK